MSQGIILRDVVFAYEPGRSTLDCPFLSVEPGLTLLVGPNGSGKSTLMKVMAGIEMPDAGTVTIDGHNLWKAEVAARKNLAYVPEQPDLTPYASIGEIIRVVTALREAPASSSKAALQRAGLETVADRSARQLSMGQRRRVLLAAAFIGNPTTVLLDEPLETLDREMRPRVITWILERAAAHATVVVSTHDLEPFLARAGNMITVSNGQVHQAVLPPEPERRQKLATTWAAGLPGPIQKSLPDTA